MRKVKKLLVLISIMLLAGIPGMVACSENTGNSGNTGFIVDNGTGDGSGTPAVSNLPVGNIEDALNKAIMYLQGVDPENAPDTGMFWMPDDKNHPDLVGGSTVTYSADSWEIDMNYPVVALENMVYDITVRGETSGWYWKGTVNAQGVVTETTPFAKITEEVSRQIAEDFVMNSPTYRFDGLPESFAYSESEILKSPYSRQFMYTFESRDAGYGNRADMMLAQVITPHTALITVVQGKVDDAVLDGKWDMLKQQEIETGTTSEQKGVSHETVGAMLADNAYEVPVSVAGEISMLGELLCPCFELTSGGESVQVFYGLMVENDGTGKPDVDMTGFANGDKVIVTGMLKGSGGTHYNKGDFWLEYIIPVNQED